MKFIPGAEGLGNINPDRVEFDEGKTVITEERVENPTQIIEESGWTEVREIPGTNQYSFSPIDRGGFFRRMKHTALASLALTAALNLGEEQEVGRDSNPLKNTNRLEQNLSTIDTATMLREVESQVCSHLTQEFMHRFTTQDENGVESFNPGAFIVPFAISLSEECRAKVDVEIHIPYHFARTFTEISARNPESRDELISKLSTFIQQEVQDQLVIRGIAGVTNTTMVWNRENNSLYQGKPVVDFRKMDVSDIVATGLASAEAERSITDRGSRSLENPNSENIELAGARLEQLMPILAPAFLRAGVDPSEIENIKSLQYEDSLNKDEINQLAAISKEVLGDIIFVYAYGAENQGSDEVQNRGSAYELVQEYNNGNPLVLDALDKNPEYREILEEMLDSQRGVSVEFTVATENTRETVYPVVLALPLLLLLLGNIKMNSIPGITETIHHKGRIIERSVPDTITRKSVTELIPARRRLFSETTPQDILETRSFDEVYDTSNVQYEDKQKLIDHLLIEEVLPSLGEGTKEPYIDYENIVNRNRQYLRSDTRTDGIEKGAYDTTPEAERRIAADLIEMWEQHDANLYPMEGIDVKTVLNYRHSDHVVSWAKPLAELFVHIMKQTDTTEEFGNALHVHIKEAVETEYKDRNVFVKSSL